MPRQTRRCGEYVCVGMQGEGGRSRGVSKLVSARHASGSSVSSLMSLMVGFVYLGLLFLLLPMGFDASVSHCGTILDVVFQQNMLLLSLFAMRIRTEAPWRLGVVL